MNYKNMFVHPTLIVLIMVSGFVTYTGCSKKTDSVEKVTFFEFHFSSNNFLSEDIKEIGGATISEEDLVSMEEPGDSYRQIKTLAEDGCIYTQGVVLFTGEGSYLRFKCNLSKITSDLDFSVISQGEQPLCFRKINGFWWYLSGKGTVVVDGKEYQLGADRNKSWFMGNFASVDAMDREKAVLELSRYTELLVDSEINLALKSMLSDKSPFVRRSAAIQVGRFNLKDSIEALEMALSQEKDENASFAMKEALVTLQK